MPDILTGGIIGRAICIRTGINPWSVKKSPTFGCRGEEYFFLCGGSPGRDDDGRGGEVDKGNAVGGIEIGLEG